MAGLRGFEPANDDCADVRQADTDYGTALYGARRHGRLIGPLDMDLARLHGMMSAVDANALQSDMQATAVVLKIRSGASESGGDRG